MRGKDEGSFGTLWSDGRGMTAHVYVHGGKAAEICHGVKRGDGDAIAAMADFLASRIAADAVLVPAPQHTGRAQYTLEVARRVRDELKGRLAVTVRDVLETTPHEPVYEQKRRILERKGTEVLTDVEVRGLDVGTMRLTGNPTADGSQVYFIDNVIATGRTFAEAERLVPGMKPLVFAAGREYIERRMKENMDNREYGYGWSQFTERDFIRLKDDCMAGGRTGEGTDFYNYYGRARAGTIDIDIIGRGGDGEPVTPRFHFYILGRTGQWYREETPQGVPYDQDYSTGMAAGEIDGLDYEGFKERFARICREGVEAAGVEAGLADADWGMTAEEFKEWHGREVERLMGRTDMEKMKSAAFTIANRILHGAPHDGRTVSDGERLDAVDGCIAEIREGWGTGRLPVSWKELESLLRGRDCLVHGEAALGFVRPAPDDLEKGVALGWTFDDTSRGYAEFAAGYGGAAVIERLDDMGLFASDREAAEQAARDGYKILETGKDLVFPPSSGISVRDAERVYVDTAENRAALKEFLVDGAAARAPAAVSLRERIVEELTREYEEELEVFDFSGGGGFREYGGVRVAKLESTLTRFLGGFEDRVQEFVTVDGNGGVSLYTVELEESGSEERTVVEFAPEELGETLREELETKTAGEVERLLLEEAKVRIRTYFRTEFKGMESPDFSDPAHVPLAYAAVDDSETTRVRVEADLLNFTITRFLEVGGKETMADREEFGSMAAMLGGALDDLDLAELTSVPDRDLPRFIPKTREDRLFLDIVEGVSARNNLDITVEDIKRYEAVPSDKLDADDVNVLVQFRSNDRENPVGEDLLLSALNGEMDGHRIDGARIDFNPITREKSGDIADYVAGIARARADSAEKTEVRSEGTAGEGTMHEPLGYHEAELISGFINAKYGRRILDDRTADILLTYTNLNESYGDMFLKSGGKVFYRDEVDGNGEETDTAVAAELDAGTLLHCIDFVTYKIRNRVEMLHERGDGEEAERLEDEMRVLAAAGRAASDLAGGRDGAADTVDFTDGNRFTDFMRENTGADLSDLAISLIHENMLALDYELGYDGGTGEYTVFDRQKGEHVGRFTEAAEFADEICRRTDEFYREHVYGAVDDGEYDDRPKLKEAYLELRRLREKNPVTEAVSPGVGERFVLEQGHPDGFAVTESMWKVWDRELDRSGRNGAFFNTKEGIERGMAALEEVRDGVSRAEAEAMERRHEGPGVYTCLVREGYLGSAGVHEIVFAQFAQNTGLRGSIRSPGVVGTAEAGAGSVRSAAEEFAALGGTDIGGKTLYLHPTDMGKTVSVAEGIARMAVLAERFGTSFVVQPSGTESQLRFAREYAARHGLPFIETPDRAAAERTVEETLRAAAEVGGPSAEGRRESARDFVLGKLGAAGIEVVSDGEEFGRMLADGGGTRKTEEPFPPIREKESPHTARVFSDGERDEVFLKALDYTASPLVETVYSRENYRSLFAGNRIESPVETVWLGEGQFVDMCPPDRNGLMGAVYETVAHPSLVLDKELVDGRTGGTRSVHVYGKSFVDASAGVGRSVATVVVVGEDGGMEVCVHNRSLGEFVGQIGNADEIIYADGGISRAASFVMGGGRRSGHDAALIPAAAASLPAADGGPRRERSPSVEELAREGKVRTGRLEVTKENFDRYLNIFSRHEDYKDDRNRAAGILFNNHVDASNMDDMKSWLEDRGYMISDGRDIRKMATAGGGVYGFVREGKIYLNPEVAGSDVPVHEYIHLWDEYIRNTNADLWRRGKEAFRDTSLWNEVTGDPNHADMAGDDDLVLGECHARICGPVAQRVLEQISERDGGDAGNRVVDWNKEAWAYIAENCSRDTDRLAPAEQFMASPMRELWEGGAFPAASRPVGNAAGFAETVGHEATDGLMEEFRKPSVDRERVERLLDGGADPLSADGDGNTVFHLAAAEGDLGEDLEYLLREARIPRETVRKAMEMRNSAGMSPVDVAVARLRERYRDGEPPASLFTAGVRALAGMSSAGRTLAGIIAEVTDGDVFTTSVSLELLYERTGGDGIPGHELRPTSGGEVFYYDLYDDRSGKLVCADGESAVCLRDPAGGYLVFNEEDEDIECFKLPDNLAHVALESVRLERGREPSMPHGGRWAHFAVRNTVAAAEELGRMIRDNSRDMEKMTDLVKGLGPSNGRHHHLDDLLFDSCTGGNFPAFRLLMEGGADPSWRSYRGREDGGTENILHRAAKVGGDGETRLTLLHLGARHKTVLEDMLSERNAEGLRPLDIAERALDSEYARGDINARSAMLEEIALLSNAGNRNSRLRLLLRDGGSGGYLYARETAFPGQHELFLFSADRELTGRTVVSNFSLGQSVVLEMEGLAGQGWRGTDLKSVLSDKNLLRGLEMSVDGRDAPGAVPGRTGAEGGGVHVSGGDGAAEGSRLPPTDGGSALPDFSVITAEGLETFSGCTVMGRDPEDGTCSVSNGDTTLSVPSGVADEIASGGRASNADTSVPEGMLRTQYADHFRQRTNTAYNFRHNLSVYCRKEANSPCDALRIAREIIARMPKDERKRTRRLLGRMRSKDESLNELIVRMYHEAVKEVPLNEEYIRRLWPQDMIVRRPDDTVCDKGRNVADDGELMRDGRDYNLKVGDTLGNVAVRSDKVFGRGSSFFRLEGLKVVSASEGSNTITLMDGDRSYFKLPRDTVLALHKERSLRETAEERRRQGRDAIRISYV